MRSRTTGTPSPQPSSLLRQRRDLPRKVGLRNPEAFGIDAPGRIEPAHLVCEIQQTPGQAPSDAGARHHSLQPRASRHNLRHLEGTIEDRPDEP